MAAALAQPTLELNVGGATPEQAARIAEHFRQRPRLDFNPIVYADAFAKPDWWRVAKRDEPDRVLKNEIAMFGKYAQLPADIDWNGMVDEDRETMWTANRFGYLVVLKETDEKGADPKYARKGVELMLDWVAKCPVERAKEQWAAWRPLEIGLRLNCWCQFLDHVARKGIVQPAELCVLLHSIEEQCDYLQGITRPGRGNHGLMENMGLGVAALSFPELKGANTWLKTSLANFQADVQTQVYPDGSHEEMSPIYEFTVLCSLTRVGYLAAQRNETLPPAVLTKIEAINRYLSFIRKPDGTLPAFNDGDRADLSLFFELVARWRDQRDVLWVLTNGKQGDRPASPSVFFNYSGLAIFRGDWGRDADSLLLDAGPFGTGHQHLDSLQVEYSAFGQDFLVEPGRYTYRKDPIRDWLIGTHSHCTVTVDGGHQRSLRFRDTWRTKAPIDVRFKSSDQFGYARGSYTLGYDVPGAESITHRRSIFFRPGKYAVIYDSVQGQGEHRVHLQWSCPPVDASILDQRSALLVGSKANLLMRVDGPPGIRTTKVVGQKDPPVGWFSDVYNVLYPAPHISMTVKTQLPARFATLLVPFRGPTDAARSPDYAAVRIDPSRDEQVTVTLGNLTEQLTPAGLSSRPE